MPRGECWYDVAEVCLNGHVISEFSVSQPQHHQEYCDKCGAKTIQECPICNTAIRGYYHVPGVVGGYFELTPPSFCSNCGQPFPWTTSRLDAARELVMESDELSPEEKELFSDSFPDVISDTPRTTLAATRFVKYVTKIGGSAATALREIFVDIASETAKKIIWPNG